MKVDGDKVTGLDTSAFKKGDVLRVVDGELRAVKERPILFKEEMVKAILAGHKTVTRRHVKHPERLDCTCKDIIVSDSKGRWWSPEAVCPYGSAGEILWVKETWREPMHGHDGKCAAYRAGGPYLCGKDDRHSMDGGQKWKSSMFMPRWASRILLEIVSVRIERLNDITDEDAWREGVQARARGVSRYQGEAVHLYKGLWDEINGEGAFDLNPYVWRIEFKVL